MEETPVTEEVKPPEEEKKIGKGEKLRQSGFFNWKSVIAIILFLLGFAFYFFFAGFKEKPFLWLALFLLPSLVPTVIDMFQVKGGFSLIRFFKVYILHLLDVFVQAAVLIAFFPLMALQMLLGIGSVILIIICGLLLIMVLLNKVFHLPIRMDKDFLEWNTIKWLIIGFVGGMGLAVLVFGVLGKDEKMYDIVMDFFTNLHEKLHNAIQRNISV